MPIAARSIRREHVEVFIAAELERTAPSSAATRLFLDTGIRLEGMAGLRFSAGDPEASDMDLRSRVVRIAAKGRRELVLPIAPSLPGTLTGTSACAPVIRARPTRGSGSARKAAHGERRLSDDQGPGGCGRAS